MVLTPNLLAPRLHPRGLEMAGKQQMDRHFTNLFDTHLLVL